ncbi:MAG: PEP/pyruvate-binding domain-containing protein [Desulforhopalus sp.]
MKLIYSPDNLPPSNKVQSALIGGKAKALFTLYNAGLPVPKPLCIGTGGYELFVVENQLREKINLELHRKDLKEMRWEEIWDISLQIQNLFLGGVFPAKLSLEIKETIEQHFRSRPLVIRSSAPDEDSKARSFAGLHESYVNVSGFGELIKQVKKVWASLWSDRAILYRQELGLEVASSSMAVVIQEFIEGASSGIVFSRSPLDESQMIIEAVHGLNQGLVDGAVEPDRWVLDREDDRPPLHSPPADRDFQFIRSDTCGVHRRPVEHSMRTAPPLNKEQVNVVAALGKQLENFFGTAQDVEWTLLDDDFYILQSRPVTAKSGEDSTDKRSWYLSLHRSYDNLLQLWESIDTKLLPGMDQDASELSETVLEDLSDAELADELQRRLAKNDQWTSVYWSDFIPFAHGVRLFGEMYNDVMEPVDSFEFVSLLAGQKMLSTERNRLLYESAKMVRADSALHCALKKGTPTEIENEDFRQKLLQLKLHFSMAGVGTGEQASTDALVSAIILQYASLDTMPDGLARHDTRLLESLFIRKGREKLPMSPEKLLEMARASYRLRDDDNIHIGRIAQELERAAAHARERLEARGLPTSPQSPVEEISKMLRDSRQVEIQTRHTPPKRGREGKKRVNARQIQGQPASRGIAKGRARVINVGAELKDFQKGEILVIDSIDPTMTFFAPLAAGIIERRGGMLIHGAIIAREYGIPCITGIVDATSLIHTGDIVTVDGYLGICTVQRA